MVIDEAVLKEFIDVLYVIAEDAGDNLDRAGEYTGSKIYDAVRRFREETGFSSK